MREQFPERATKLLAEGIEIVQIHSGDWKTHLLGQLISNSFAPPSRSLLSILDLAEKLECKAIVVEQAYVSLDFLDEYAVFYARQHRDVRRSCKRLHFFSGVGANSEPVSIEHLLNLSSRELQAAYKGYSVIRPTAPLLIGDTVLASPFHADEWDLVHCQSFFDVHLLGRTLTVRGMPFIEQDSVVSVCAEADLWMLGRYLHSLGECRRFFPSEMYELASSGTFLGDAREGLEYRQMLDALRRMNLRPEFFAVTEPEEAVAYLYSCVESELPVIACVHDPGTDVGHVVTIIGHGYHSDRPCDGGKTREHLASWVDAFVGHDDAQGPYRWLEVGVHTDTNARRILTLGRSPVSCCIFAEPPGVNLRRSDVLWLVHKWFFRFLVTDLKDLLVLSSDKMASPHDWWTEADLEGLVTREYLRRNDKFKTDIYPPDDDGRWLRAEFRARPLELVLRYWRQSLPKYVWVVELARQTEFDGTKPPWTRRIVGEVLIDPTVNQHDYLGAIIAFHLDDRLLIRKDTGGGSLEFDLHHLSLHNPYSPLLRHRSE